ncbi:MAG: YfhO family protein [Isosphaeraceae bacterium]
MSSGESGSGSESGSIEGPSALFPRRPWGRGDLLALLVWTLAIGAFFWDVVGLRRALFYFDITEINYPYRAFFAEELKAGRFSRWFPGLYCGLPLFSESQAGYFHPFKYLFYPWLATWQALNLDTVLSIWMAGAGTYLWLRRHVGPAGALTGAAVFGLSGFLWGHLIHTSMINAMASVPFVIWGLESSWESGRWRGAVLGGVALACQVFAGHLQDALLMVVLVGLYGLYRAATERNWKTRGTALGMAVTLVVVGVLVSAVQWVPSKELLDRSPRAGGLPWGELVFGSWGPELLPTLVVREAYGTRARDTDWLDGFYPYHEMNTYMGLIAMALAVVGAGGMARRDRWANFWVLLVGIGALLMMGKFTFLFDGANEIPVLGSSREPVRFHLWVSLGVAALSAVGVERLGRPGAVSLRGGLILAGTMVMLSIPIMIYIYNPVWNDPKRWILAYHLDRYRWLGRELVQSAIRTGTLAGLGWLIARAAARSTVPARRSRLAALLPLLVIADLLGAHWRDVPTIEPRYWTQAPESARRLKDDPSLIRIFAKGDKSAGEPGYASERVNFLTVRDPMDWSLPPVWHVPTSRGNTPMISSRLELYARLTEKYPWRHDLESDSHIVTGRNLHAAYRYLPSEPVGTAYIHRNAAALPRARLVGNPVYADDLQQAAESVLRLGDKLRNQVVVEDPTRPLPADATVSGTARIIEDLPEKVAIETDASMPSYLVLSDTFDPGWSATIEDRPVPIRPAYIAFRAVYLPGGKHTVVFTYRPAGFVPGLALTGCGIVLALILWFLPRLSPALAPEHAVLAWPSWWRIGFFGVLVAIVLASIFTVGPGRRILIQERWRESVHTHTWGSGMQAQKGYRM